MTTFLQCLQRILIFPSICENLVWDGANQENWVMGLWCHLVVLWLTKSGWTRGSISSQGQWGENKGRNGSLILLWFFPHILVLWTAYSKAGFFQFLFVVEHINSLEEFGMDWSKTEQSSAQTLAIIWVWIFLCKPSKGKTCHLCRKSPEKEHFPAREWNTVKISPAKHNISSLK